jgi:hypothetical protein
MHFHLERAAMESDQEVDLTSADDCSSSEAEEDDNDDPVICADTLPQTSESDYARQAAEILTVAESLKKPKPKKRKGTAQITVAVRKRAIKRLMEGACTAKELAAELGVEASSISNWKKKHALDYDQVSLEDLQVQRSRAQVYPELNAQVIDFVRYRQSVYKFSGIGLSWLVVRGMFYCLFSITRTFTD